MRSVVEHLLAFCDRHDPNHLHAPPKRFGAHIYATNRICMLRIPLHENDPSLAALQPIETKNLQKWDLIIDSARARSAAYLPLPVLPAPIPCAFCSGTGNVGACPHCDDGLFEHGGNDYECQNCHGTGQRKQIDGDQVCHQCNGLGEDHNQTVKLGSTTFTRRYLALLAALPGIRIAEPIEALDAPVYFSSTIGDGVIMPCRFVKDKSC